MKKSFPLLTFAVAIAMACASCGSGGNSSSTSSGAATLSKDSIISLAKEAYVFGYPIVVMHQTMRTATNLETTVWNNAFAPVNQFGHYRSFPDATFKAVVKPNCDTY